MAVFRKAGWQALLVGVGVAVASRTSEWAFQTFWPHCPPMLKDLTGMSIAGITAGLLFFLWRVQLRKSLLLVRDRERAIRHVHHHLRNSLQVILYRSEDPVVRAQIERILREVEVALPSKPADSRKLQKELLTPATSGSQSDEQEGSSHSHLANP